MKLKFHFVFTASIKMLLYNRVIQSEGVQGPDLRSNKSGLSYQPQCDIITRFIIQSVHTHSLHFSKCLAFCPQTLHSTIHLSVPELLYDLHIKTPTDVKILLRHLSQLQRTEQEEQRFQGGNQECQLSLSRSPFYVGEALKLSFEGLSVRPL